VVHFQVATDPWYIFNRPQVVHFGWPPRRKATIRPGEDYLGRVSGYVLGRRFRERLQFGSPRLRDRYRLEKEVICFLAGPRAEHRFSGRRRHIGASADHKNAVDYLFRLSSSANEAQAYAKWLEIRTEDMLQSDIVWRAVERIAAVLVERETLTATEVRAIYDETLAKRRTTM
jgi:hypothetical protein